ncbi:MAG: hypothetical protein IPJ65_02280 [Archangiaceae bacterium]|nr:hypothetical protein [Archangiaceae bacterium]
MTFIALAALLAAEPEKLDVAALKPSMHVYTDGKKHYLVAALDPEKVLPAAAYYGDGKSFYQLRSPGGGGDKSSWSMSLWEPRAQGARASLESREGKVKVECSERTTALEELGADAAKALLEGASFFGPRWQRLPYLLARDEKGNYYYVDMQRDVPGKKDLKLYIGPRGKLKLQQMTNIVSDSVGDIFSTKSGELRLVANDDALKWVAGKAEAKLTRVPVDDNHVLIYTDLGIYERMPLGTPCDDL